MTRKRFTRDETAAFTPDARVQWRNGSHWHRGTVAGPIETDSLGLPYVPLVNHASTRTVSHGEPVRGYPGMVKMIRCNHHDGPHRDDPGRRCAAQATIDRVTGDYRIPVCAEHATGPGLWQLGRLFYGFDR